MTEPASPSPADVGTIIARLRFEAGGYSGTQPNVVSRLMSETADMLTALVTRCDEEDRRRVALAETQARLSVASEAAHRLAGHLTHDPDIWERAEWETCEEEECVKDRAALALAARVGDNNKELQEGDTTMTGVELKQAAIDCLAKAFKGGEVPVHVVQAAVSIFLTPDPDRAALAARVGATPQE